MDSFKKKPKRKTEKLKLSKLKNNYHGKFAIPDSCNINHFMAHRICWIWDRGYYPHTSGDCNNCSDIKDYPGTKNFINGFMSVEQPVRNSTYRLFN